MPDKLCIDCVHHKLDVHTDQHHLCINDTIICYDDNGNVIHDKEIPCDIVRKVCRGIHFRKGNL